MQLDMTYALLLIVTGIVAGVINTLAGGGANLTLPALMVMGMPADIANATKRVAVLLQSLTALAGFRKYDKLPTNEIAPVLVPTLIGGLGGALAAGSVSIEILKPLLLGYMLGMTGIMLVRPDIVIAPAESEPRRVKDTPASWFWLGLAGLYGGFVQAGVGFMLITALAGTRICRTRGSVVFEVPPRSRGHFWDLGMRAYVDIGDVGPDKGQGGKYIA